MSKRCFHCIASIIQITAGTPPRLVWATHPDMDVWCDARPDGAGPHSPIDDLVPDLTSSTDVRTWLDKS